MSHVMRVVGPGILHGAHDRQGVADVADRGEPQHAEVGRRRGDERRQWASVPLRDGRQRRWDREQSAPMNQAAAPGEEVLAHIAGGAMLYDAACLDHPDPAVFDPAYWQARGALQRDAGRARHDRFRDDGRR